MKWLGGAKYWSAVMMMLYQIVVSFMDIGEGSLILLSIEHPNHRSAGYFECDQDQVYDIWNDSMGGTFQHIKTSTLDELLRSVFS